MVYTVHLHAHSCYSLLDSISRLEDIVSKVKELGHSSIALTDHGNVYGAIKMYKLCKKYNIKFIYGCEFYICDDIKIHDKNNRYSHLLVLAKNETGRQNLNILLTKAHLEGKYYKPRIDFQLLQQYHEGLVISSACMAGEISRALLANNLDLARSIANQYKQVWGNDYYLEIQSHTDPVQQQLNQQIVALAKDLGIQWVVTTDNHYVNKQDQEIHNIFVKIGEAREAGETYNDCYLQSEDEVRSILATHLPIEDIDAAINNTDVIASKCNVDIPLSPPIMPHIDIPAKYPSEMEYLKDICRKGWLDRGIHKLNKEQQQIYLDRLLYEFNAIDKMGFAGYYLLVYSYSNAVQRRGIARGSSGGSLVAYLMHIVDIDPIKYGLYFERFIDVSMLDALEQGQIKPEEIKVPDVDLDFGVLDREKVLQHIVNQYGADRVVSIGQFTYMQDKLSIKDIGRVLDIPYAETDAISKMIDDYGIEETINKYARQYPKLFKYAKAVSGLPRSFGVHPSGKIIANRDMEYYNAVGENNGELVLQCDMHDAEDLGLVKIDLLGLRTLDVIYDTLAMIHKDYNYISPLNIDFNDSEVWNMFCQGDTSGIFQFESGGMRQVLKKMQPTCIDDLAVANALYRPGAKRYIDNYIARKHGEETYSYIHPDLDPILKSTFGIIVFQEELIDIGRLAGLRNPDNLRKACAKKIPELMDQIKPELQEGLLKSGWTDDQIEQLWNDMLDFAKYSFNRAHSYAYAITAYITAMLKVHHPVEFFCALLNSYAGKFDKISEHGIDIIEHKITFLPSSYKKCSALCTVDNNAIRYGIGLIKHCNIQIADELQKISNKQYSNFIDLLVDIIENTKINTKQLKILITLNFFSEFGHNGKLLNIFNKFTERYKTTYVDKTKRKRLEEIRQYAQTLDDKPLPIQEQIIAEMEYLGYVQTTAQSLGREYAMITDINTKYTPRLNVVLLCNGESKVYKVKRDILYGNPTHDNPQVRLLVNKYDIIRINNIYERPKVYKKDEEWVETGDIDEYISSFAIVQKYTA